jgi:transposase-like protein
MNKIKEYISKPEVLVLLISLGFTALISTAVGTGGYLITGKFWGYFIISLCIQFIIFAIVNTFLLRKDTIEGANIVNKQLEELSKFAVRLTCSYCQQSNNVPILLNQENRFKCDSCNQINGVKMQFFSTQITTPLAKVLLPAGDETVEIKTSLTS